MMTTMTHERWWLGDPPQECPDAVPSHVIMRLLNVSSSRLFSWQRAGWVQSVRPPSGSGGRNELWWAPWAVRMLSWLAADRRLGTVLPSEMALRLRVRAAIERYPDAVYLVDTGAPDLVPSWSAGDATELLLASTADAPLLVSLPMLPP